MASYNNLKSFQSTRSYYRLCHSKGELPDGKTRIHIPSQDHPKYLWATQGIQRRDNILELKFHCNGFLLSF
jgi:GTP-dependent phosphoenolpyruvate carboxykinase